MAEVVDDVVLLAYRRKRFATLVQADPAFGPGHVSILSNLDRCHNHMVSLGRKTALERIATFLLEVEQCLSHTMSSS